MFSFFVVFFFENTFLGFLSKIDLFMTIKCMKIIVFRSKMTENFTITSQKALNTSYFSKTYHFQIFFLNFGLKWLFSQSMFSQKLFSVNVVQGQFFRKCTVLKKKCILEGVGSFKITERNVEICWKQKTEVGKSQFVIQLFLNISCAP